MNKEIKMRILTVLLAGFVSTSAFAAPAKITSLSQIKTIVCRSEAEGYEDSANVNSNLKSVVVLRNDEATKKGRFLLDEYSSETPDADLTGFTGQIYNAKLEGNKFGAAFIAEWKAYISLEISYGDNEQIFARGQLWQKGVIRDLRCNVQLKK